MESVDYTPEQQRFLDYIYSVGSEFPDEEIVKMIMEEQKWDLLEHECRFCTDKI